MLLRCRALDVRSLLACGLLLLCCCEKETRNAEEATDDRGYSLVAVEMKMVDWHYSHSDKKIPFDYHGDYLRFAFAGPSVVREFSLALNSQDDRHHWLAREALTNLARYEEWPEIDNFLMLRLKGLPASKEAGTLLSILAARESGLPDTTAAYAAHYLSDETVVCVVQHANKECILCVQDYACVVLQKATKNDWGAEYDWRDDDAKVLDKAKAWVKANPDKVKL